MARCAEAAVQINVAESQLTPVQSFTYVGMQFDLLAGTVSLPPGWLAKIGPVYTSVLEQNAVPARELYRLYGSMIWMCLVHNRPMCTLAPVLGHWSELSRAGMQLDSSIVVPEHLKQWLQEQFPVLAESISGVQAYDLPRGDTVFPCVKGSSDSSSFGAGYFCGNMVRSWYWKLPELEWHIYSNRSCRLPWIL